MYVTFRESNKKNPPVFLSMFFIWITCTCIYKSNFLKLTRCVSPKYWRFLIISPFYFCEIRSFFIVTFYYCSYHFDFLNYVNTCASNMFICILYAFSMCTCKEFSIQIIRKTPFKSFLYEVQKVKWLLFFF